MNLTLTTPNTLSISVTKDVLTINFQPEISVDVQGAVALTVSSSEAAVALAKPF